MIWGISRGAEKDRHQQKDGKFGLRSPRVKTRSEQITVKGISGCGASIFGDIQNLTGCSPPQSALVDPALSVKLDTVT